MRVLCILQNAWGSHSLPLVFKPNPLNKSAKVVKKILGEHTYLFSNTTPVCTPTAKGKPVAQPEHVAKLFTHIRVYQPQYGLILVCGKQAEQAVKKYFESSFATTVPIMYIKHPAARDLSNVEIEQYKKQIANYGTVCKQSKNTASAI